MKKVSNNKIAQHQFNSKTVYHKHRKSSHVTQTSQLLDLSLFFSVSTPFSRNSSWTPGNVTILGRDPVADTGDHPRRCCLQRFRTETAGGVCTFGLQPKPFERKMRSFVTIANTQGTWSTQTNKQTNSKISPAMYHNTHIFWYWPFKYTVFFDPGSVKKIEIFGRELPLRRASVSKKKIAANAAIFLTTALRAVLIY